MRKIISRLFGKRRKIAEPPTCFRPGMGEAPGYQEQAENDCEFCPWSRVCLDRDPPVKVLP